MLTAAGSGYSRWRDLAVTRWREDATCDDWGSYVFLRDVDSGDVWSAGFQPSGAEPDDYDVAFNEDRAEFARRDGTLTTTLEVRRLGGRRRRGPPRLDHRTPAAASREIDVTSYAELVLAPQAADVAHPAFSKLFVETEYLAEVGAILATRRRRAPSEPEIWAAHLAVVEGGAVGEAEIETDRARFLGRGRSVRTAIAVIDGRPLSNTVGTGARSGLRPAPARADRARRARCASPSGPWSHPRAKRCSTSSTSIATPTPSSGRPRSPGPRRRCSSITSASVRARRACSSVSRDTSSTSAPAAAAFLRRHPARRRRAIGALAAGHLRATCRSCWCASTTPRTSTSSAQLLQAHEYWRMKQLAVDLVILNERASSYVQDLQIALETLVAARASRGRSSARTRPRAASSCCEPT